MDKSLSSSPYAPSFETAVNSVRYGFPLALQLFAFKAIPSLLEKISEPINHFFLARTRRIDSTNALLNFEHTSGGNPKRGTMLLSILFAKQKLRRSNFVYL
ncbi:hypothetical protein HID58_090946 [Brassica napus]|uniref:Uncharacterized protein n=1 Tax=Brassica napus TaxID=3708 RepID=A0ABQ7X807_BRANA|nr:hypothetical protein HID58_090946 [Brassica napus]